MKRSGMVENIIRDYGKEAFQNHREEVYEVLRVLCFSMEFLQNQEDWKSWQGRAIPLRDTMDQSRWEEEFREKYDAGLRREQLWNLKEELEKENYWNEKPIPLKGFFDQGFEVWILDEIEYPDIEDWLKLMETQMAANGYRDYRAFLEAVYMMGFYEIFGLQDGTRYHFYKGDYRDAEHFLKAFRDRIPAEEYKDYDGYCSILLGELEKNRMNAIEQTVKERDKRLEKAAGKIPVLKKFHKVMEDMEEAEFENLIKSQFFVPDDGEDFWEGVPGWDEKTSLRYKKIWEIRYLTELFIYGNGRNKERLFKYLSEEQQMVIMERWMLDFYSGAFETFADRLRSMSNAACPGMPWPEYKKDMLDSMEKIAGRPFTEEDAYWL